MNVICIGDSLTEGYVTKNTPRYYPYSTALKKILKQRRGVAVKVSNIGLSGKTSNQILQNLKKVNQLHTYDVAVVLAGTNDLLNKPSSYIVQKLKRIHTYCLDQGISRVYALSVPQIIQLRLGRPLRESKRSNLNSKLKTWCTTKKHVTYVPFGETFVYDPKSKIWAHNGYHLSPQGYAHMGEFIAKKIITNDI